jgi:hypothetical protein
VDNPGEDLEVIYPIGSILDLMKSRIPNFFDLGQIWKPEGRLW